MPFNPANYMESVGNVASWQEFIEESEPVIKVLTDRGCTVGEAINALWLNRILNLVWYLHSEEGDNEPEGSADGQA